MYSIYCSTWSGERQMDHRALSWASVVSSKLPDAKSKIWIFPLCERKQSIRGTETRESTILLHSTFLNQMKRLLWCTLVPTMICLSPGTNSEQSAYSHAMVRITCKVALGQKSFPVKHPRKLKHSLKSKLNMHMMISSAQSGLFESKLKQSILKRLS